MGNVAVDLSDVNAAIEKNMAAFDKPGVLSVRPGFKVTKDWLTNTKSIVVTVRHKVAHPPEGEMLPAEVGGVPVDVRQASPEKALELEYQDLPPVINLQEVRNEPSNFPRKREAVR